MTISSGTWSSAPHAAHHARISASVTDWRHLLRHSFAVVTLEQLQRGHLASLAAMTAEQRGHYTRIFGDPLDWVRRRMGHASIASTLIYLHALQELEMRTRMELVPDDWEDPPTGKPETGEAA